MFLQKKINIFGNLQQIATRMVIQYGWGPDDSPTIYHHNNAVLAFRLRMYDFISRECAPVVVYIIYYSVNFKTEHLLGHFKTSIYCWLETYNTYQGPYHCIRGRRMHLHAFIHQLTIMINTIKKSIFDTFTFNILICPLKLKHLIVIYQPT